jgi:hypothetical protein
MGLQGSREPLAHGCAAFFSRKQPKAQIGIGAAVDGKERVNNGCYCELACRMWPTMVSVSGPGLFAHSGKPLPGGVLPFKTRIGGAYQEQKTDLAANYEV